MLFTKSKTPTIRDIEYAWDKIIVPKFTEIGFKFDHNWITIKVSHTSISPLAITLTKRVRYSKAIIKELSVIIDRCVSDTNGEFEYMCKNEDKITAVDIFKFINSLGYLYTVIGTKDSLELKRSISQVDKLFKK